MERKFLITVSGDFNETDFTVEESIYSAIENEVQDVYESAIYNCDYSVKEVTD